MGRGKRLAVSFFVAVCIGLMVQPALPDDCGGGGGGKRGVDHGAGDNQHGDKTGI